MPKLGENQTLRFFFLPQLPPAACLLRLSSTIVTPEQRRVFASRAVWQRYRGVGMGGMAGRKWGSFELLCIRKPLILPEKPFSEPRGYEKCQIERS